VSAELDLALAAGDARRALEVIDLLGDVAPERELEAWMIAGHARAVTALLPRLDAAAADRARAFLADPGHHDEPPAPRGAAGSADDYAALDALRAELAARGRVRAVARLHLALADLSPRPDWRWLHVDHAGTLARVLGDARLEALVLAHEAMRDADFGEDDDALERVDKAVALAREADEPRALALAERARSLVAARAPLADAAPDPEGLGPAPPEEPTP